MRPSRYLLTAAVAVAILAGCGGRASMLVITALGLILIITASNGQIEAKNQRRHRRGEVTDEARSVTNGGTTTSRQRWIASAASATVWTATRRG